MLRRLQRASPANGVIVSFSAALCCAFSPSAGFDRPPRQGHNGPRVRRVSTSACRDDDDPSSSCWWSLATVDLEGCAWSAAGRPPPPAAVVALRDALDRGDPAWFVANHGATRHVAGATEAATAFFDQPFERKLRCAVGAMERSRGYELYPQHAQYRAARLGEEEASRRNALASRDDLKKTPPPREPSAADHILAERYAMGPPECVVDDVVDDDAEISSGASSRRAIRCATSSNEEDDPYYASPFARVFYERNVWPSESHHAALRAEMTAAYEELYRCAVTTARVLAAALGADFRAFDALLGPRRHHSRFQINHYPSVRFGSGDDTNHAPRFKNLSGGPPPARANAHHDTSVFTLLARPTDDAHFFDLFETTRNDEENFCCAASRSSSSSTRTTRRRRLALPGSLEIRDDRTGAWRHVPPGPRGSDLLTCQLGSLVEYLTRGQLRAATHRVRLPHKRLNNRRRLSAAFVLKPDYAAPATPPPLLEPALRRRRPFKHDTRSDHLKRIVTTDDAAAHVAAAPPIGLVGRVGWQTHAMLNNPDLTKDQAKAGFKAWKIDMRARLGLDRPTLHSMTRRSSAQQALS